MSNIVIIGASSGIGRELALLYGQNPANNLVLAARREPELHSLAAEIQGQTVIEILDLESPDRTEKIDRLLTHFSTVDLVIYSSGYSASKSYILRYMEGLSRKARKEKVSLACTTILPGF